MNFQFAFKHMESSDALQHYAESKIKEKVLKFVTKPIEAKITFSVMRHEHRAQCSLLAGDGFSLEVEHVCDDMYGSVDLMIDKLTTQLKRQKDKLKDHKFSRRPVREKNQAGEAYYKEAIDAGDILKYEQARKKLFGS